MPTLFVVATPIGNLEDVSLRALRTLRAVRLIAAEDTRTARRLLDAYDIRTAVTSYHEHNKWAKLEYLLHYLEVGGDVALVSEAGTPGIADPGHELIVAASERGIPVVAVPGPSVVISALAVSALPTDRFTYLGFLPRQTGKRQRLLQSVAAEPGTLVVLEAPHRLQETLQDILVTLGDRRIAVCRELTKVHEEVFRSSVSEAIVHFAEPRGEFTLIIEGAKSEPPAPPARDVERKMRTMRLKGMTAREAVAEMIRETGLSKRELYRVWLKLA